MSALLRRLTTGALAALLSVLLLAGPARAAEADEVPDPSAAPAAEAAPEQVFEGGLAAYKAGRYHQAAEAFQALANRLRNPEVHYNLGNARYQQGRLGAAVVAWKRALREDPRASDVVHNLQVVTGASPWGAGVEGSLRQLYLGVTLDGLELAALAFLTLAWLGFAAYRLSGRRVGLVVLALSLGLALTAGLWAYARSARWVVGREAVILGHGAVVATAGPGPQAEYPRVFTVHPGQLVRLHRSSGRFRQVSLPTGAAGWVPRENLEEI